MEKKFTTFGHKMELPGTIVTWVAEDHFKIDTSLKANRLNSNIAFDLFHEYAMMSLMARDSDPNNPLYEFSQKRAEKIIKSNEFKYFSDDTVINSIDFIHKDSKAFRIEPQIMFRLDFEVAFKDRQMGKMGPGFYNSVNVIPYIIENKTYDGDVEGIALLTEDSKTKLVNATREKLTYFKNSKLSLFRNFNFTILDPNKSESSSLSIHCKYHAPSLMKHGEIKTLKIDLTIHKMK